MRGQGRRPAGDLPLGGAGGHWVHGEPAVGTGDLRRPATQPVCVQGGLTKIKPGSCLMMATQQQKQNREPAETKKGRKFPRISQLCVINHRKCETVFQVPWLLTALERPGLPLSPAPPFPGGSWCLLLGLP